MTPEIAEHDIAVLTRDLPDQSLRMGDFGVVIHVHREPSSGAAVGYMLEIFAANGEALDERSVPADAVRAAQAQDRVRVVAAE